MLLSAVNAAPSVEHRVASPVGTTLKELTPLSRQRTPADDEYAQFRLAVCYALLCRSRGLDAAEQLVRAREWLGFQANMLIGKCLETGKGLPRDETLAAQFFQAAWTQAIDQGVDIDRVLEAEAALTRVGAPRPTADQDECEL